LAGAREKLPHRENIHKGFLKKSLIPGAITSLLTNEFYFIRFFSESPDKECSAVTRWAHQVDPP
jgi:hypothetical protein